MARYSVADAKNNLPKLIDRALAGEEVEITRRGEVVVSLSPKRAVGAPIDMDWIERHQLVLPDAEQWDSADLIRQMRDEYRY